MSVLLAERPPGERHPAGTRAPILDHRRLRQTVGREYAKVALFPDRAYPWPVGRAHARALGYSDDELDRVPCRVVESFCGAAYLLEVASPRAGETVVDVGSGSGVDALLAAERVGNSGRVVGIDLTRELSQKAELAARVGHRPNVRFEVGLAEAIPLDDATADVVLANGVVNLLVADKVGALREMARVLRPGGRLVLGDIAVSRAAAREDRSRADRWLTHQVGAVPASELVALAREAGFAEVTWSDTGPAGSPARAADAFARRGRLTARKPDSRPNGEEAT